MSFIKQNRYREVILCLFIMGLSVLVTRPSYAGVVLGNTRLIYPADSREVSLSLKNTEVSQTFMIQSIIENSHSEKQQNFVVAPPLLVLKPGGENKIRVFLKNFIPMSADRETLFWLSIKAIPSISRQEDGNFVQFAVTNKIKLLYRPKGLISPDELVWKKIIFSRRGDEVVMFNPTPYFMNIASVRAGGLFIESLMLAPYETQIAGKTLQGDSSAEVVFINDFGGESEKISVPFS